MSKEKVRVHSRNCEQFLYFHNIFFSAQGRGIDGTTYWEYEDSPRLREEISEFNRYKNERAKKE